jgi:hypothetical protein
LILIFIYGLTIRNWDLLPSSIMIAFLGFLGATSLYRSIDRPKRLRRLIVETPERIRRGYIEYRFLPYIRRRHMTYLHLIDDSGRNHVFSADDSTLINLIEEIKRFAPRVDWHSGEGSDDRKGGSKGPMR